MSTYEEKLSILSEMISFARVDSGLKKAELEFLQTVADHLGVDEATFGTLLYQKAKKKVLKSEGERLVQFHRLLLLMNIDQKASWSEINKLHEIGVQMGLSPTAIDRVIEVMHQYPDRMIPTERFIEIFKTQHN